MSDTTDEPRLDRRHVLGGFAAFGIATPLLAACGDDTPAASTTPEDDGSSPSENGSGGSSGSGGGLVAAADVPVGGGVVLGEQKIVVTQPAEGEFKAFSAICTHQGCPVGEVADGTIVCPCHGSQFSVEDGSVVNGPATSPLEAIEVAVEGGQVVES